jgi:hypothetical protein
VRRSWSVIPMRVLTCSACVLAWGATASAAGPKPALDSQDWRDYARGSIQPAFDWATQASAVPRPSGESDVQAARKRLVLSIQATTNAGAFLIEGSSPLRRFGLESVDYGPASALRFTQSAFMPELHADLGARAQLRVGVTIASQRFATPGFGEVRAQGLMVGLAPISSNGKRVEQSFGQGVHAAIGSRVFDRVDLGLSAQSRVDMDAFKSYRGVFTEPGDFDMPARTGLSLGWQAAGPLTFTVGAERIFYGGVNAFTTRALPPRFLAFLGDGSSPRFAWRDLTVYSVEAAAADRVGGQWGLRWTSRQQPSPTSTLLELALRDTYSDTNLMASYRRAFGAVGNLTLGASYAPSQYILGAGSFGSRFSDGAQLEVELNWSMAF